MTYNVQDMSKIKEGNKIMKLIDKDALVAEIEKRVKEGEIVEKDIPSSAIFGLVQAYKNFLSFIDTLEVKEVDFVKEFYTFSEKYKLMDKNIEFSDIERTASFFFQLGLKAQKGE